MSKDLEVRELPLGVELRQVEGAGGKKIVGTALKYNALSEDLGGFREQFLPGAFGNLEGIDVIATIHHDTRQIIGRTPRTLKLADDAEALRYEIEPLGVRASQDAMELIENEVIRGSSFTFRVKAGGESIEETEAGEIIRTVTDAELFEVAPVVKPAYPQTDSSVAQRSVDLWKQQRQEAEATIQEAEADSIDRENRHLQAGLDMLR